jgi:PadR family transcriptional regulator, regulatory protein AphA
MPTATPHTYGLLGVLSVRSWTGYELTRQVRRSLRFIWRTSEGHLYREQRRLAELGWVRVDEEPAGRRTRKRYEITDAGRRALAAWFDTEPAEPQFQLEGLLRLFFADQGSVEQLRRALTTSAAAARAMLVEQLAFVDDYLADGGPLALLEAGAGGPAAERLVFRGRPMYPERLHVVARSIDLITTLLAAVDAHHAAVAADAASWRSTTDPDLTPGTRAVLEAVRDRGRAWLDGAPPLA